MWSPTFPAGHYKLQANLICAVQGIINSYTQSNAFNSAWGNQILGITATKSRSCKFFNSEKKTNQYSYIKRRNAQTLQMLVAAMKRKIAANNKLTTTTTLKHVNNSKKAQANVATPSGYFNVLHKILAATRQHTYKHTYLTTYIHMYICSICQPQSLYF